jgi:hypothetical protein
MAQKKYFNSITDLISDLSKSGSNGTLIKGITGEHLIDRASKLGYGKSNEQKQALLDAAKKGAAEKSIQKQLAEAESYFSEQGYNVNYEIDKKTARIQLRLIPQETPSQNKMTKADCKFNRLLFLFTCYTVSYVNAHCTRL